MAGAPLHPVQPFLPDHFEDGSSLDRSEPKISNMESSAMNRDAFQEPNAQRRFNAEFPAASGQFATAWIELIEDVTVCSRVLRRDAAEATGQFELSDSLFWLIWACRNAPPGGLSQNQLASAMAISDAQVSALVEQLRRRDFLTAHRGASDRRRQFWTLTSHGTAIFGELIASLAPWAREMEARFGADRRVQLAEHVGELLKIAGHSLHGAHRVGPPRSTDAVELITQNSPGNGSAS